MAFPSDWPRISSALFCDDAAAHIDWLCKAFGFEIRIKVESEPGQIVHSELVLGDGLIMVAPAGKTPESQSPRALGGANTQKMMFFVEDVDAHCARARAAGARIVSEPKNNDYGEDYWEDRSFECVDPEGHHWYVCQRIRSKQ